VTEAAKPLNLLDLARSEPGRAVPVPGTDLRVMALQASTAETLTAPTWLLLITGDLLVDLPFGDFRHLEVGDSVVLPAEPVRFEPIEPSVVLRYG
jgi:hypothetical protein